MKPQLIVTISRSPFSVLRTTGNVTRKDRTGWFERRCAVV